MEETPKYTETVLKIKKKQYIEDDPVKFQQELKQSYFEINQEIKRSTIQSAIVTDGTELKNIEQHIANLNINRNVILGEMESDIDEEDHLKKLETDFEEVTLDEIAIKPEIIANLNKIVDNLALEYQEFQDFLLNNEDTQEVSPAQIDSIADSISALETIKKYIMLAKETRDIEAVEFAIKIHTRNKEELLINPQKYKDLKLEINSNKNATPKQKSNVKEDFKEAINPKHIIEFRKKILFILEKVRDEYQNTLRYIFADMEEYKQYQEDYSNQIEKITDAVDALNAIEQRLFKAETEHDIQLAQVGLEVQEKKINELCINPRKYREIVNNITNPNTKEYMRTKVIKLFEEILDLLSTKTDDELEETLGLFLSLQSKEEEILTIIDPNPKNIELDNKTFTIRSLSEIMIKAMVFQNSTISGIIQNAFSTESISKNEWSDYFSEHDIVYMLTTLNERQLRTIMEGL